MAFQEAQYHPLQYAWERVSADLRRRRVSEDDFQVAYHAARDALRKILDGVTGVTILEEPDPKSDVSPEIQAARDLGVRTLLSLVVDNQQGNELLKFFDAKLGDDTGIAPMLPTFVPDRSLTVRAGKIVVISTGPWTPPRSEIRERRVRRGRSLPS